MSVMVASLAVFTRIRCHLSELIAGVTTEMRKRIQEVGP
jgi:hypothetical protein